MIIMMVTQGDFGVKRKMAIIKKMKMIPTVKLWRFWDNMGLFFPGHLVRVYISRTI